MLGIVAIVTSSNPFVNLSNHPGIGNGSPLRSVSSERYIGCLSRILCQFGITDLNQVSVIWEVVEEQMLA